MSVARLRVELSQFSSTWCDAPSLPPPSSSEPLRAGTGEATGKAKTWRAPPPPLGVEVKAENLSLFEWEVEIEGPQNSPYQGGVFLLSLQFPPSYPSSPPLMRFQTPIFHPNIDFDSGLICLDMLKREHWREDNTVSLLLHSVLSLLLCPHPTPVNLRAAKLFLQSPEAYLDEARRNTEELAKPVKR